MYVYCVEHNNIEIILKKMVSNCIRGLRWSISRHTTICTISIVCPSRATWLHADCCFSELALWKSN